MVLRKQLPWEVEAEAIGAKNHVLFVFIRNDRVSTIGCFKDFFIHIHVLAVRVWSVIHQSVDVGDPALSRALCPSVVRLSSQRKLSWVRKIERKGKKSQKNTKMSVGMQKRIELEMRGRAANQVLLLFVHLKLLSLVERILPQRQNSRPCMI